MRKILNEHIAGLDCAKKTAYVLSGASRSVSITLFVTVIEALIGKANTSISQCFLALEFFEKLKSMRSKRNKHKKLFY